MSAAGLLALRRLKRLNWLSLLGCWQVDDAGVAAFLARPLPLEYLNLSGTGVGVESLYTIKEQCPQLQSIDLRSCNNLSPDHEQVLPDLAVDIQDDLIRFHLLPHQSSRLPKVADSVLRARSTLNVQRIACFIQRRLLSAPAELVVSFSVGLA